MNINNINYLSYPSINFGNKTRCLNNIGTSKPMAFLDKYAKERTDIYTKKLLKDLKCYIASKKGKLSKEDIKGIVAYGGLSTIFDLGNNKVLKCSFENPLEFRKHNSVFDIPFLSQVEKFGDTYFVQEVKAETKNITIEDCKNVIERIYKEGYEPSRDLDKYRTWQIGKHNNIPYLLDTRAAVPRPNSFSRFIYDCCNNYKRVFYVKSMNAESIMKEELETAKLVKEKGLNVLHMDETPRANLSYKDGLKKVSEIIQENIKFGQWNKLQGFIAMFETIIVGTVYKTINKINIKK